MRQQKGKVLSSMTIDKSIIHEEKVAVMVHRKCTIE